MRKRSSCRQVFKIVHLCMIIVGKKTKFRASAVHPSNFLCQDKETPVLNCMVEASYWNLKIVNYFSHGLGARRMLGVPYGEFSCFEDKYSLVVEVWCRSVYYASNDERITKDEQQHYLRGTQRYLFRQTSCRTSLASLPNFKQ
jgi:hypothetical protein